LQPTANGQFTTDADNNANTEFSLSGVGLDATAVVFTVGESEECNAVWGSRLLEGESGGAPSAPSTFALLLNLKVHTEEEKDDEAEYPVKPTKNNGGVGQKIEAEGEEEQTKNLFLWLGLAVGLFVALVVLAVIYKRRSKRSNEGQPLLA